MYIKGVQNESKYSAIFPVKNEYESLKIIIPFLLEISEYLGEILIIADDVEDSSFLIEDQLPQFNIEISFILNEVPGVFGAVQCGISHSKYSNVIICAADELIPLFQIDKIAIALNKGFEFVSATRYTNGGRRYGGNALGKALSWGANKFLSIAYRRQMTDFTTGFKGFQKMNWDKLAVEANGIGWSFALKFSLNAIKSKMKICEIPIISLDRTMGGQSAFKLMPWVRAYLNKLL
jgi:glycosyltransferase involved in cell wall biosynthesis